MFAAGRRILIVEDEDLLASLLSETLVTHGFVVETASNVVKAREAVREFDPDAVLLDISLGEGPSGVDLAYALHTQHPEIAIIFLTKHPTPKAAAADMLVMTRSPGSIEGRMLPVSTVVTPMPSTLRANVGAASSSPIAVTMTMTTMRLRTTGLSARAIPRG